MPSFLDRLACVRRRHWIGIAMAGACVLSLPVQAQETAVEVQLDWRIEGPADLFFMPAAKGHFKAEKFNVTIDAGNGAGGTVTRVASGACDTGFADLGALMELRANNPTAPSKPVAAAVAVAMPMPMVCDHTPAAVLEQKESGLEKPADLNGKKLGAPVFDAGRKAWPIFAKTNGVSTISWTAMDPALRETLRLRGDIDAITGYSFTPLPNLEASGVEVDDAVLLPYPQYGVKLHGNAIIVSEQLLNKNPEVVQAFLRAFAKGVKDVVADPKGAIDTVEARDGIINDELELRRHTLTLNATVLTPDAGAEGIVNALAPRLALMASQAAEALATKACSHPDAVWNASFLRGAAERDIFAVARK